MQRPFTTLEIAKLRCFSKVQTIDLPAMRPQELQPGMSVPPAKSNHPIPNVKPVSVFHLALESSTPTASICIFDDASPITCRSIEGFRTTSSRLIPEIANALQHAGIQPQQIGLVSVSVGPGSFTGLRIGVMLAKSLIYALPGASLVGVDTHELIARQGLAELSEDDKAFTSQIASIINAQRGQWFVSRFDGNADPIRRLSASQILSPTEFTNGVDGPCWMCGPGLSMVTGDWLSKSSELRVSPRESWEPSAAMVGQIGWSRYQCGETADPWRLNPVYGRASAAEEKLTNVNNDE